MATSEYEVVIIGGGAAGIAAARRLHDAGAQCLLIEAQERLGGRAWTWSDPAGFALDLGCGWLHSADRNPWVKIAEQQGRTIDRTPPPWQRASLPYGFPHAEQRDFLAAMEFFFDRVHAAAESPDRAAAELLAPGCRWNGLIGAVSTFVSGGELTHISLRDLDNYADSDVNWRVSQGYGATITAHGAGVPVAFGTACTRIDHSGVRLRIETARGTIITEQLIVTLPTSLLAAEAITFAPALPEKTQAAQGLPLGLADKLFLALGRAEEFEPDSRVFGHTDRIATAVYHLRPFGRPQIEAYFGGDLAWELEAGGDQAFFNFAAGELSDLFGRDFARRIKPIRIHRWGHDSFARGSYSFALPGKAGVRAQLAASIDDRLFFAGEACSIHDYSTAHGALLTGLRAAEEVITARTKRALSRANQYR